MAIIDFDKKIPYFIDLKKIGFNGESIRIIEDDFSIETFIKKVKALCELKK